MATFFGEILPVTSRAVDDDDDEDEDAATAPPVKPIIHWMVNVPAEVDRLQGHKIPCTVIIIALSKEANAFSDVYLQPFGYDLVGEVLARVEDDDSVRQSSPTDTTCNIFRCRRNPAVFLCQCQVDVLPEHCYNWAKLFVDTLDLSTSEIIILTSSGMSGYCSDLPFSDLETPFLRCLKTESSSGCARCKILEQPNMLTGLAAELMTFFQIHQYKAVTYICYKEKRYMDISEIKVFSPVLQTSPVKDITEVNKNAEQMLRDIVKLHSHHDMMYM